MLLRFLRKQAPHMQVEQERPSKAEAEGSLRPRSLTTFGDYIAPILSAGMDPSRRS